MGNQKLPSKFNAKIQHQHYRKIDIKYKTFYKKMKKKKDKTLVKIKDFKMATLCGIKFATSARSKMS